MYAKEGTFLVGYSEQDAIKRLEDMFFIHKPELKDTSEGNKKMLVLGWSIVFIPKPDGCQLLLKPMWVNDKTKSAVNMMALICGIFSA